MIKKAAKKEMDSASDKESKAQSDLNKINEEKKKFLKENPEFDVSGISIENNKDFFEFIGGNKAGLFKGIIMFFIVIILDLFTPFVMSISIFLIQPEIKKVENTASNLAGKDFF
jgi:hypothetical protein